MSFGAMFIIISMIMFFYSGVRYTENANALQRGQYLYVSNTPSSFTPACRTLNSLLSSLTCFFSPRRRSIAKRAAWLLVNILFLVALICATMMYISR